MFSLICARINDWVNNGEAGDLRRIRVHYDVIVMVFDASASTPRNTVSKMIWYICIYKHTYIIR